MKLLFDYFPIFCFFITFKFWGIYAATGAAIGACALQMLIYWLRYRRFEKFHVITLIVVSLLGGLTLILHRPIYIQWKPTVVYWIIGLVFFAAQFFKKGPIKAPLMRQLLKEKIELPNKIWLKVDLSAGLFFIGLGILNIYVAYHYSPNAWVNFKVFGTLGLMLAFIIGLVLYISRYLTMNKNDH